MDTLPHNRLKYEPTTGEYVNNHGVETRVPDFGGTSSIEYMDPDTKFIETTDYFHDMIQWFVDKGYTRGKDIVGAPYDWRYSPSKYGTYPICKITYYFLALYIYTQGF